MAHTILSADPFNLIITGVGGQGNVLASKVVGNMLIEKGFHVTIGETFGASQRGGSVMSHLRISAASDVSPQIPKGTAHVVVALEPTEGLRVLRNYGNPNVCVLCNMRPIHPVSVICGDMAYPTSEQIEGWIRELSGRAWFVNSTESAIKLGNPILSNIILVGALAATGMLPLDHECFESTIAGSMRADKVKLNLNAFNVGYAMI